MKCFCHKNQHQPQRYRKMKFKNNKYPNITDLIADEDIKAIINAIMDAHDSNPHKYDYKVFSQRNTYLSRRYIHNYDEFLKNIKQMAFQEYEELQKSIKEAEENRDEEKLLEYMFGLELDTPEEFERGIMEYITDLIIKRAEIIIKKRSLLRLKKGELVDFSKCTKVYPFYNNIEFYKDGGWGIANKKGIVLLKNNLEERPSKISRSVNHKRLLYLDVMRDIDTGLYGVVSLNSYKTCIPFSYDNINICISRDNNCLIDEIDDFYWKPIEEDTNMHSCKKHNSGKHIFFIVHKNNKCGCYSYKGEKLIECKYDEITVENKFIECSRDGEYKMSDYYLEMGETKYEYWGGVKDLYDTNGQLIIGGYKFLIPHYDYMEFLINSNYLIVDNDFKSLLKINDEFFKIPIGTIYDTPKIKKTIPSQYLFNKKVDLSGIYDGFIYLMDCNCEEYIIPDYVMLGFSSHEEINKYTFKYNTYIQEFRIPPMNGESCEEIDRDLESRQHDLNRQHLYERYIIDNKITIIKISKDRTILWKTIVNEIGKTNWGYKLYRIGAKCGFYTEKFLYKAEFSAISIDGNENEFYVAKITSKYNISECTSLFDNPNYNPDTGQVILYFKVINNTMIKVQDDWRVFNPKEFNWFPKSFKDENGLIEEEEYYYDNYEEEWTDEDGWDAMTDENMETIQVQGGILRHGDSKKLSFHKACGNKTIAGYEEIS